MKNLHFFAMLLALFVVLNYNVHSDEPATPQEPSLDGLPCDCNHIGVFHRTPVYDYTPVLRTNMPHDVMIGYIGMDSVISHLLERFSTYDSALAFIKGLPATSDTLLTALKYMYRVADYDPALYDAFLTTDQNGKKLQPYFLMGDIENIVRDKFGEMYQGIWKAQYILHIRVDAVPLIRYRYKEECENISETRGHWNDLWTPYCRVLDTIKGKVLPKSTNTVYLEQVDTASKTNNSISVKAWPFSVYDASTNTKIEPPHEEALIFEELALGSPFQIGEEYIVFLWQYGGCTTDNNRYYVMKPLVSTQGVNGVMPIANGIVYDYYNSFGFGKEVPVEEFKAKLEDLINTIRNYGE